MGMEMMAMVVDNHAGESRCQRDPTTSHPPDVFFPPDSLHQSPQRDLCVSVLLVLTSSFSVLPPPPLHLQCLSKHRHKDDSIVVSGRYAGTGTGRRGRWARPGRRGKVVLNSHDLRFLEKKKNALMQFVSFEKIYIHAYDIFFLKK